MNITKLTLLGASALLFIGCSGSPEDAVYGMYDALSDGDMQSLLENTTEGTATLLTMGATMQCKLNKKEYSDKNDWVADCMEKTFGDVDIDDIEITEISDNKAKAKITATKDGKETVETMDLVKIDDTWKVSIHK